MASIFKRENLGFGALQWFFWSSICTINGFLVFYLKTKDYSELQIGVVMASVAIISIFGQPFWGNYCDRNNTIRNVLVFSLLTAGISALLIPVFVRYFPVVILICLVISFTEISMPSIIDSWTLNTAARKPWVDYGLTRGMGSMGFATTSLLFGVVLARFSFDLIFYAHFLFTLAAAGFCFFISRGDGGPETVSSTSKPKIALSDITLKGSGKYLMLLLSSTLVFTGFRATTTFYPVLLTQMGAGSAELGLSLFIMAAGEFPVLFFSRILLKRFKDTSLISFGLFFVFVRIALHVIVPVVPGLIAIQLIHSISFAVFLPASLFYIARIAPAGHTSTYLTVATSCYFGIGNIMGSFLGGVIINRFDIKIMLICASACAFIGFLIFFFSKD